MVLTGVNQISIYMYLQNVNNFWCHYCPDLPAIFLFITISDLNNIIVQLLVSPPRYSMHRIASPHAVDDSLDPDLGHFLDIYQNTAVCRTFF